LLGFAEALVEDDDPGAGGAGRGLRALPRTEQSPLRTLALPAELCGPICACAARTVVAAQVEPQDVPAEALPDLRSVPAWAIRVSDDHFLNFAATVWNAGPSPLVVDGFRRDGEAVMDAYQYFYDADGVPHGYCPLARWNGTHATGTGTGTSPTSPATAC
jgi:hypothetical protein